ncbi:crotonobetainyl-CoA--carnitine CoA-transferase [Arcobacter cryaerophilus gv. occultus]|uniref:crotonobetainyl-CoA--carnitine CoA-transferase n=1 Tax=Aliarcobacter cryaerophilus TaxID=28198 RepID=UPI000D01B500|nr:crotonobetainyl-CoA--carnitine CoA-transferase [Aliarcobacter cryaerophilus]PRM91334.1 crotonobetainyl-CoA--carnitine CoA-transferase [Arcobacter cryaerophilus gv. occultus]
MSEKLNYKMQKTGTEEQMSNREKLNNLFQNSPMPIEHLMVNLGLYMRSSVLAKTLYINELYEKIVHLPGSIMEFGSWYGTNLALFESLRAIYDPYNYTRKVIGFDTYDGYENLSINDGKSELVQEGQYSIPENYIDYLKEVLDFHQKENVLPHIKKYELIKGDATKSVYEYLEKNQHTMISLAYFDMQLYEPTKKCLEAIKPYLVKGAVIAMDEINNDDYPGETIAFREVFGLGNYEIHKSRYLPDRSYMIYK